MTHINKSLKVVAIFAAFTLSVSSGCTSDGVQLNNTTTGAVAGTALGAGLGAIVGNQTGHPGAGVAIGAGAGALGGALIGAQGDAQNSRADEQEERLRRQEEEPRRQRRELDELRGSRNYYRESDRQQSNENDRLHDDLGDDFSSPY